MSCLRDLSRVESSNQSEGVISYAISTGQNMSVMLDKVNLLELQ